MRPPVWADDSATLTFDAEDRGAVALYRAAADGTERPVTTLTDAFHRRRPAHPTERSTVASPSEGELDAWLVTPRDRDRSSPQPVLRSIHGGPFTQCGERWFDEFQQWAEAGYCVQRAELILDFFGRHLRPEGAPG